VVANAEIVTAPAVASSLRRSTVIVLALRRRAGARAEHPPPPYRPGRAPGEAGVTHDPDPRNWWSSGPGILPTPCQGFAPSEGAASMRVLIVEDDDAIATPLVKGLEREGLDVDRVETGTDALAQSSTGDFDVVLLDLGLPDRDGFDVCRELRARSDVPIIVVTARSEEVDRVVGLELGADDYIVKPFGFRELLARIRAVARRRAPVPVPAGDEPSATNGNGNAGGEASSIVEVGTLTVDRRTRRVTVDGAEVALTPKEFDLLAFLADDAGAVRPRQELLENVWDPHWYGPTKTLDVHVASLRKKLGDPGWIETVRGVGFRLRALSE
jgi:two-component system response regulator RegX3